jgi:tetratricopeptide (TPR) repeat protein
MILLWIAVAAVVAQQPSPSEGQAAALFRAGMSRYQSDDAAGALPLFQASYRLVPSPVLLVDIGQCLKKLGRKGDAAHAYRQFLESRSGAARVRAEVFEALDELEGRATVQVVETSSGGRIKSAALFQRGRARYQAGEYALALEAFKLAREEFPAPDLWVNIAQCLRKLDRPEEAVLAYHQFLRSSDAPRELRLEVWEALDDSLHELDVRLYKLAESAALLERLLATDQIEPQLRSSTQATVRQIRESLIQIDEELSPLFPR